MRAEAEMTDEENFRKDYEATAAAMSIIRTYAHPAEKKLGKQKYRMDCDMFQAAARHTGLIERMPRYWSANTGRWTVHIPLLLQATHGLLPWNWNDHGECDFCPDKSLCYDCYKDCLKEAEDDSTDLNTSDSESKPEASGG